MRGYLAWALTAAAAVLVALPGTAHATGADWIAASCATGSFDPATRDAQAHILVPAHMTLCVPYKAKYNWTIVRFREDSDTPIAVSSRLIPYAASGPVDVIANEIPYPWETDFGLCLMRSLTQRTACVRVDLPPGGPVTTTPIPVTDPLVAKQVAWQDDSVPNPTDPYCGTCV